MYPVSSDFLKAVEASSRKYRWSGSIKTSSGKKYDFANKDILKGSGYINRKCCSDTSVEIGTAYAAELGITLLTGIDRYALDGAEITLFFHLTVGEGREEEIPMGIFEVSEANRTVRCLEIKAYDYMLRFDKDIDFDVSSGTAYDFLNLACGECDVKLGNTREEIEALPNGKETLGVYEDNDMETFRDLICHVAQALCCVCLIDREGKLRLYSYVSEAAVTIPAKGRFESRYSDFVTKYTRVTSSNRITGKTEKSVMDVHDGLSLSLGTNPLMQFGLKETRKRFLKNILEALKPINYVPFDSTTIGNPALDPLDVICFTGGHADGTKKSCITSITYRINGKHTLKGVGKNPKLAGAKSRQEKDYDGVSDEVGNAKTVVRTYTNAAPYKINDASVQIITISFTTKKKTSALFYAEILLDAKPESGQLEVAVAYRVNDAEDLNFHPVENYNDGNHTLTLFYPLGSVKAQADNIFDVYMSASGGSISIGESQIRAVLTGQGIVSGESSWNGRLSLSDSLGIIEYKPGEFKLGRLTGDIEITAPNIRTPAYVDTIGQISIESSQVWFAPINERTVMDQAVTEFRMDSENPGGYEEGRIGFTSEGSFCIQSMEESPAEQASIMSYVDVGHESITGIRLITAECSGEVGVKVSYDGGISFEDEVPLSDWISLPADEIYGNIDGGRVLALEIVLHGDAVFNRLKITYKN